METISMKERMHVYCKTSFIGFHCWSDAPENVKYLRDYQRFSSMVDNTYDAKLYTVEVAHGTTPFSVTLEHNPYHLQLRTNSEIWHKENAINLMLQRVQEDEDNVAWVDSDVSWANIDW